MPLPVVKNETISMVREATQDSIDRHNGLSHWSQVHLSLVERENPVVAEHIKNELIGWVEKDDDALLHTAIGMIIMYIMLDAQAKADDSCV